MRYLCDFVQHITIFVSEPTRQTSQRTMRSKNSKSSKKGPTKKTREAREAPAMPSTSSTDEIDKTDITLNEQEVEEIRRVMKFMLPEDVNAVSKFVAAASAHKDVRLGPQADLPSVKRIVRAVQFDLLRPLPTQHVSNETDILVARAQNENVSFFALLEEREKTKRSTTRENRDDWVHYTSTPTDWTLNFLLQNYCAQ